MVRQKDSLGDRMKGYETAAGEVLPLRLPVIMRLDGRAFHTWTRGLDKPFDAGFIERMSALAKYLCQEISTAEIAYVQSDEISLLLHNYKRLKSQAFFGNNRQKMVSVSAGMASAFFTHHSGRIAIFDSRVYVLPESEVVNYFIWRQQDATRNSVQMLARSLFSHRELHLKKILDLHEMMHAQGVNWVSLPTYKKRGLCVIKDDSGWTIDLSVPIFSQNREYIGKLLAVEEE